MYRFLFTALVAGIVVQMLSSASEVHAGDPKANPLQGSWTLVSTEEHGKVKSELANPFTLVVSGTTVRLRHGEQLIWEATIKQHSADKAGRVKFDLTYDRTKGDAPPPEDHGSCYGIFQVRGDELKFSTAHGSKDSERPKDFSTAGKAGAGRKVFTWHRAEKAASPPPALGIKLR
jgi:uncharacterized protein (TIGR03067 family)